MARTSSEDVESLLQDDYGPTAAGVSPSLAVHVNSANKVVTRLVTLAGQIGVTYDSGELELIERWVAAWFYTQADPIYASRSSAGASASFVDSQENRYMKAAKALAGPGAGILGGLLKGQVAGAVWGGKPASEQIPLEQRD